MEPKVSKVTIAPGWAEVRMTLQFVAGLAHGNNAPALEHECVVLAERLGLFPGAGT